MCPYPRGRRRCGYGCLVVGRRKLTRKRNSNSAAISTSKKDDFRPISYQGSVSQAFRADQCTCQKSEIVGKGFNCAFESSEHTAVPELARTRSRLGREFDTIAHVGITRSSIEPVTFRLRSLLFIKKQKHSVSIYWVRGRSKDALGTTVKPNYEASIFCHCRTSIGARLEERPRLLSRDRPLTQHYSPRETVCVACVDGALCWLTTS